MSRYSRNDHQRGYFWTADWCLSPPAVLSYQYTTTTTINMDRASKVLAEARNSDTPRTWAALSERGGVPLHTLYYRARGRPSREEKAQRQQYLTVEEEKALVTFLLLMSSLRQPIQIKYIPSLAFSIARRWSTPNKPIKPPGKNWARAFEKRQPEVKAKRVRSIDWNRHEKLIYNKITE